jgi:FlaA1/EpsC-like NDP-sugar epimerase
MEILRLIGRSKELFANDIAINETALKDTISTSSFLVIGGAGSIGQAVVKEIFKRQPKVLHVVDISENNMVELVRDIRSSLGYIEGDFRTFALDAGSIEFNAFLQAQGSYDYVLNLSALKHVRSEKDPYTLMRMINVNIMSTEKSLIQAIDGGSRKYFCVSTDKAANPVNMMGASKRIMEMFLMRRSLEIPISTARFANVAFSDGSLLHGFNQRIQKRQPLSAPQDVKRYFVTQQESGELCLMSCLLGENRDIFFPKLSEHLHLITFAEIAVKFLEQQGYEAYACVTEDEARAKVDELTRQKRWPCYFFNSDTTGEKDFEEFFTDSETLDMNRFESIGVIKNDPVFDEYLLNYFVEEISKMKTRGQWSKEELVCLYNTMIPSFNHKETGKYLDGRM